jgi:hypothetical protein
MKGSKQPKPRNLKQKQNGAPLIRCSHLSDEKPCKCRLSGESARVSLQGSYSIDKIIETTWKRGFICSKCFGIHCCETFKEYGLEPSCKAYSVKENSQKYNIWSASVGVLAKNSRLDLNYTDGDQREIYIFLFFLCRVKMPRACNCTS